MVKSVNVRANLCTVRVALHCCARVGVFVIARRAPCVCSNEYRPWYVDGMQHVEQHV